MKKIEEACKILINKAVDGERTGWPPVCVGFFHQPERPVEEVIHTEKKTNE